MLQVIAWWGVPLLAFAVAGAWAGWRGRVRRPARPERSVAEWRRAQAALARAGAKASSSGTSSTGPSSRGAASRRAAR